MGTNVSVDPRARFIERGLVSGGSPWRLLRLPGSSREVLSRWRNGGRVGAGEERFARTLVQQGLLHPRFDSPLTLDSIDVIVPVHDDTSSLTSLLDQLDGFHVTVVDDGSSDHDSVATSARAHGTTLLRLDDNRGPASARNAGAQDSTRDFLWFVDVDVTISDARRLARRLQSEFSDPLVSAVAPRVRGADGPSRRERFERHFGALDMGADAGLVVPGGSVSYVPSACLMVRRDSFGDGFDESLRHGEDVDLVWRLHDAGWLVRYLADAEVTHRARTTWREWWRQRQRYGESSAELAKRHGSRLAPLRVDTWTLAAWTSVLVGQPAVGARLIASAQRHARDTVFSREDDPNWVASQVITTNMVRAGGPLARGVVRTFGATLLLAAFHPRLRSRALVLFTLGTAWRWRHRRVDVADIPLGVADDLAYGAGVIRGAWRTKSLIALTPRITRPAMGLREALGLMSSSRVDGG
ncbi:MAG TPA: mycofactocin biosynthesis glycosyltransferase MftF [Acidimicrobiales bacterium]|nr:mycofactocin biosynthesis glycosyltransferase MftF [Acidimicrobiales bacterium]